MYVCMYVRGRVARRAAGATAPRRPERTVNELGRRGQVARSRGSVASSWAPSAAICETANYITRQFGESLLRVLAEHLDQPAMAHSLECAGPPRESRGACTILLPIFQRSLHRALYKVQQLTRLVTGESERRHTCCRMHICVIRGSSSHQLVHVEVVFLFIFTTALCHLSCVVSTLPESPISSDVAAHISAARGGRVGTIYRARSSDCILEHASWPFECRPTRRQVCGGCALAATCTV